MQIALSVIIVIACIILIAAVTMQEGQKQGLGAISGASETFFGKNKAKSIEGKLALITKICAVVFVVLSLVMCIIAK